MGVGSLENMLLGIVASWACGDNSGWTPSITMKGLRFFIVKELVKKKELLWRFLLLNYSSWRRVSVKMIFSRRAAEEECLWRSFAEESPEEECLMKILLHKSCRRRRDAFVLWRRRGLFFAQAIKRWRIEVLTFFGKNSSSQTDTEREREKRKKA